MNTDYAPKRLKRKRRRLSPSRRSAQLLDAAEGLFASQGYGRTSILQIADASGITRPVVYDRFGSKDGIYLAALRRARAQLEESMFDAMGSVADPRERLRLGAEAYFGFVESNPQRWRLLFGGGAAVGGDVAEEAVVLRFGTEMRLAELLQGLAPAADPTTVRALAHAVGGAAHQLAQWWLRTPSLSRDTVVANYLAFTWPAIRELLGASNPGG